MKEITGTQFCSNNIPVETPVLLMYFHPECDICSNEIKQFIEYKDSFYKINILLITNAQQDKSIKFYAAHSLFEIMNLKLLLDEDNMFQTYFGTSLVPSSFLYNNKHELVKTFQGEVKAETLINYLNQ
jgi:peroxiredoxin